MKLAKDDLMQFGNALSGALALIVSTGFFALSAVANPEARIVGGTGAFAGQFPYQVALVSDPNDLYGSQFCGGSLISENWVLTAAHCFDDGPAFVAAGVTDLQTATNAQVSSVVRWVVYPSYAAGTFNQDVALLELETPIDLSACAGLCDTIDLVSRENAPQLESLGNTALISGWGRIEEGGDVFPSNLLWAETPLSECLTGAEGYLPSQITEYMICASTASFDKDTCQGDSGGPLAVSFFGDTSLVGITSWGEGCALEGFPGVYTRVSRFLDWIDFYTASACASPEALSAELSSDTASRVQQQYVAFYGRAADYGGLIFWAGRVQELGSVAAIQAAFANSQEYRDRIIPGDAESVDDLSSEQIETLINNLYRNMFGRDGDPSGLVFWTGELSSGKRSLVDIATAIAEGASVGGEDHTIFHNRVRVAQRITQLVNDNGLSYGFQEVNDLRDWLFALIDDSSDCVGGIPDSVIFDIVDYGYWNRTMLEGEFSETESNDDFDSADQMQAQETGNVSSSDPSDFFTFIASSNSLYALQLDGEEGDSDLYLYDANQTRIGSSLSATIDEFVLANLKTGSRYYLEVRHYEGIIQPYVLTKEIVQTFDNEQEPNDALGSAGTLAGAIVGSLSASDPDDYFRYVVATSAQLTFRLRGNSPSVNSDVDLYLTDGSGASIGSSTTVTSIESVTVDAQGGDVIVANVYNYGGDTVDYLLEVITSQ